MLIDLINKHLTLLKIQEVLAEHQIVFDIPRELNKLKNEKIKQLHSNPYTSLVDAQELTPIADYALYEGYNLLQSLNLPSIFDLPRVVKYPVELVDPGCNDLQPSVNKTVNNAITVLETLFTDAKAIVSNTETVIINDAFVDDNGKPTKTLPCVTVIEEQLFTDNGGLNGFTVTVMQDNGYQVKRIGELVHISKNCLVLEVGIKKPEVLSTIKGGRKSANVTTLRGKSNK